MFTSQRVRCYLNTFSGHGDDADNKELKLVFHIAPITPQLATEISSKMADRLFRNLEDEPQAAHEISKASFSSILIPMQNVSFFSLPEGADFSNALVPNASISNLRVSRTEAMDFRLEFDMVIPMDGGTMRLVERFYKSSCFLSMESTQRELEVKSDEATVETQISLQDAADGDGDGEPEEVGVGAADSKSAAAGDDTGTTRKSRKRK